MVYGCSKFNAYYLLSCYRAKFDDDDLNLIYTCMSDVKDQAIQSKLTLSEDKTEAMALGKPPVLPLMLRVVRLRCPQV